MAVIRRAFLWLRAVRDTFGFKSERLGLRFRRELALERENAEFRRQLDENYRKIGENVRRYLVERAAEHDRLYYPHGDALLRPPPNHWHPPWWDELGFADAEWYLGLSIPDRMLDHYLALSSAELVEAAYLNCYEQCAWCLAREPIAWRLFGVDLCHDCAQDHGTGWTWAGRRRHLFELGWLPGDMPPRLEV